MAEINDLISKEAIQSVKDADKAIVTFDGNIEKLIQSLKGLTGGGSGFKDLNATIVASTKAAKDYNTVQAQTEAIQKKVELSQNKLNKENIQAKQAIDAKTQSAKLEAKATNEQLSAYDRLAAKVAIARKNYKDLAASFGETNAKVIEAQKEFNKLNNEMTSINKNAGQNQDDVGKYGKVWDGVGKYAAVAGSVLAGVWASIELGKSVINTSQYATDAWTRTVEGLKNGWGEFMNSVANWDFSNLIQRINDAAQAGRDYAEVLDLMDKRQKGLSSQHKQENEEIAKLRLSYYEHNKTANEKAAIMQKVIELTQAQSEADAKAAKQNYEGYTTTILRAKNIDTKTLESYLLFKGTTEEKVQLIETLKNAENYYNANVGILGEDDPSIQRNYKKMIELRVKGVGEFARLETKLSQQQIDDARKLYDAVAEANNAVYENKEGFYRKMELQEKKDEAATNKQAKALEKQIGAYAKLTQSVSDLKDQINNMYAEGKTPSNELFDNLKKQEQKVTDIENAVKVATVGWENYIKIVKSAPIDIPFEAPANLPNEQGFISPEQQAGLDSQLNAIDKKKRNKDITLNAISDVTNAGFEIYKNGENAKTDLLLANLDKKRNAELANDKLTAEEKQKITDNYAKKELKIKQDAWKKQHAADILQAIANGVLMTLKSGAETGPAGYIAAGIAAAASVAVIAAQKMPQFDKGTTNAPNLFEMSEKRPEFLISPQGQITYHAKPTVISGMAGSTVISGEDTERIMKVAGRDGVSGINFMPNFDKLESSIIGAIKSQTNIMISGSTGKITERSGNYNKEYFNRKFKAN